MVATLAILTGVAYLVLAVLGMGFISWLFARPVLDGFIVGLGVFIAVGQLPKVVGIEKPAGNTVQQLVELLHGSGVLGPAHRGHRRRLVRRPLVLEHLIPKVPATIVVVAVPVALVSALSLKDRGVEVVGVIPSGFAMLPWGGLTVSEVWALLPGALALVVVGFAQSLAIVKAYAAKDNTAVDANRELMACRPRRRGSAAGGGRAAADGSCPRYQCRTRSEASSRGTGGLALGFRAASFPNVGVGERPRAARDLWVVASVVRLEPFWPSIDAICMHGGRGIASGSAGENEDRATSPGERRRVQPIWTEARNWSMPAS